MNYKVDKNVPLPKTRSVYPLLEPGESFFVKCTEEDKQKRRWTINSSYSRREGKYALRTVEGGLRIWRIE